MLKKNIIIVTIISLFVLIVLAVSTYMVLNDTKKTAKKNVLQDTPQPSPAIQTDNIVEDATKGVIPSINTNPLENKPDINPADKTNPFKNVETNPFK